MPRTPFKVVYPASGGASFSETAKKAIRFARHGCTNRPFYHIVVMESRKERNDQPIEQLGTFDSLPNEFNEKLVSLNIERIRYWLGMQNVTISAGVRQLFGLAGLFPIHNRTYMNAWRYRQKVEQELNKINEEKLKAAEEDSKKESAASS